MVQVKVVIPLYTEQLSEDEQLSLKNNIEVLKQHPIVLLMPEGMQAQKITDQFPQCKVLRVSDEWLGRRNGVAGYNRMMLSAAFYDLFADCEYILICQSDAWVFRDELEAWCNRGYDVAGGVWWRRGVWSQPVIGWFFPLNRKLYGKVGNGGFSLRRVDAFRRVCRECSARIEYYLRQGHHIYNEDVFWAVEPRAFRYPPMGKAVAFSFDSRPERCLEANGGKLPFGCHGWSKPGRRGFWSQYIPID